RRRVRRPRPPARRRPRRRAHPRPSGPRPPRPPPPLTAPPHPRRRLLMLGPTELLIILTVCAALGFTLWGIADAIRWPSAVWRGAGGGERMASLLHGVC